MEVPQDPPDDKVEFKRECQKDSSSAKAKVAYTLTACVRCRHRKTRCDAGLPRCGPCERTNKLCEYFDAAKGKTVPRTYVVHLQNKTQSLEIELAHLEEERHANLDAEDMIRSAGLVRFKEHDDCRYLGASSGIAVTRLVMELAKQNTESGTIKEVVPDAKAAQIKDRFVQESAKPTSKVYPLISNVAAPALPSRDLTAKLIEVFNRTAQYLLPTLHEPSLFQAVEDVYNGSADACKNFVVRIVIAISMQKLTGYAGLADSYYLAALTFLAGAIRCMNLETLQCCALIAQYSMVTPTRTASYWVVGLATRLCQELELTSEAGITAANSYAKPNAIQIDMRRRLFWVITSMEFGLAHSLGRPSGFGTGPNDIDVQFFQDVDDRFITDSGVIPGSPTSVKKQIAIHFFKMRLHQAEIRRRLYLRKREEPKDDQDPWFRETNKRLRDWLASCPKHDEGSGLSEIWFRVRYNTMVIFLHRPSPQIPEPSVSAALTCIEAALENIRLQREQIANKSVDVTWIFTQTLFMELNTALWALSYPEVRKEKPKGEIEEYVQMAQDGIGLASERWPGVESALELYENLTKACLKAYDGDTSYVIRSPSNKPSSPSLHDITPPPLTSPSTVASSVSSRNDPPTKELFSRDEMADTMRASDQCTSSSPVRSDFSLLDTRYMLHQEQFLGQPSFQYTTSYHHSPFDANSLYNTLPETYTYPWNAGLPDMFQPVHVGAFFAPEKQVDLHFDAIGDQYSQYLHAPYAPQQPLQSLNEQQQMELMTNLERTGLRKMSPVKQPAPPPDEFYA